MSTYSDTDAGTENRALPWAAALEELRVKRLARQEALHIAAINAGVIGKSERDFRVFAMQWNAEHPEV